MYEYTTKRLGGLGQIQQGRVNIVGKGVAISPPLPPSIYRGIYPANVGVMGSGIGVSAPFSETTVPEIERCAFGNCNPCQLGTAPENGTSNGFPWWYYALAGAGIIGVAMLARKTIFRNPESLSREEAIRQAAAITIQAGIPTLLWGPPGIGKTQWVKGLGKAMAPMNNDKPVKVITVIGSTKDPTDIGGMPTIEGGTHPPSWAAELLDRSLNGLRSILFLDEFSSMSPMVHAALLRVVNEKIAGDTEFDPDPDNQLVHIVAAANSRKEGAGSRDLPPPAANRFIHFEWPRLKNLEWARLMIADFKGGTSFYYNLPEDWRSRPVLKQVREKIGTFIKYRDSGGRISVLLNIPDRSAMDADGNKQSGRAWPSPRSWEMAADALAACTIVDAPKDVMIKAVEGAVGPGAAGEFFSFERFEDLPSPEDVLSDPEGWEVPQDSIKAFIVASSLANAVQMRTTLERYEAAWKALSHMVHESNNAHGPVVAPIARELAVMMVDPRYRDTIKGFSYGILMRDWNEVYKKMKLMSSLKGKVVGRRKK